MINTQPNVAGQGLCSPCQAAAMSRMTIPQRLDYLKRLGLTAQLQALEASLKATGYQLPSPSAI
jgi:hypothetical protein